MFTHIITDRDGNRWTIQCETEFDTLEGALDAMIAMIIERDIERQSRGKTR